MANKKKCLFAVALAVWILGLVYLGAKSLDEFRSGKVPFSDDGALTLKTIVFPSLKSRDQE